MISASSEKRMTKIIKERQRFRRRPVSRRARRAPSSPRAVQAGADRRQSYGRRKRRRRVCERRREVGAGELTIYDNLRRDDSVAWKDLCRGPHVPHTGYIPGLRA